MTSKDQILGAQMMLIAALEQLTQQLKPETYNYDTDDMTVAEMVGHIALLKCLLSKFVAIATDEDFAI